MPSKTQNVKMGVCRISFGGEDLGYTKGGVEVSVTTETKPIEVDQFGNAPINDIITGRTCKVKVPLAETTLENMVRIMPGATLTETGGAAATGTVTLSTAVPVNGDSVTINGVEFTFRSAPSAAVSTDLAIGGTFGACAATLAAAINVNEDPNINGYLTATVAAGVVTLNAIEDGVFGNAVTLASDFATSANCTVSGATMTGGTDPTEKSVVCPTGVGTSLLDLAQELVIHPMANATNDTSDDFVIPLANTPGAMQFAYKLDQERIFDCEFTAYPNSQTGELFQVGSH